jgi:hypothetical protein
VNRGVTITGVGGAAGGGSGGTMTSTSTAPMSHPGPCGRVTPHWVTRDTGGAIGLTRPDPDRIDQRAAGLGQHRRGRSALVGERRELRIAGVLSITSHGYNFSDDDLCGFHRSHSQHRRNP